MQHPNVLMSMIFRKLAGWVQLPACRQKPAQPDAKNTNVFTSGSCRHHIRVLLVGLVWANCTDTLTAPTLPDHSAKFPRRKVSSDPPLPPSWRYERRCGQNVGSVMLQILLPSRPNWLPCVPKQLLKTLLFWNQQTVEKLDQTLRRIPYNTVLGSDCVQPGAIKHAPGAAKTGTVPHPGQHRESWSSALGSVVRDHSFERMERRLGTTTNRPASHTCMNSGSPVPRRTFCLV